MIAARDSFLGTLIQSVPQMPTLISHMRPTWHLASLAQLDRKFIERAGVGGLIWDVDGTLTAHHDQLVAPEALAPFDALLAMPGLRHVILSNANERRFVELGRLFPSVPVLRGYRRGPAIEFRTVRGAVDSWSADDLATRIAAGAVALRKPSAELVRRAVELLGCESSRVVMVGDQYLTDVAGAGMAGVRSIKLPTIERRSFPFPVQLSQFAEAVVYRLRYGSGAT